MISANRYHRLRCARLHGLCGRVQLHEVCAVVPPEEAISESSRQYQPSYQEFFVRVMMLAPFLAEHVEMTYRQTGRSTT